MKSPTRLVIVSNRLPFRLVEDDGKISLQPTDGGLVSALKSYFENQSGKSNFTETVWIGCADFPKKRWERHTKNKGNKKLLFNVEPLFMNTRLYSLYYNGFSNSVLWPLMHYFITYTVFDNSYFKAYEEANRIFANKVISVVKPDDVLWIHDYQLMLLPAMVREAFPQLAIGFFLHIPFPSFEIFRLLKRSWKEKIIAGILGADLAGFHTHEYVQHFLKSVRMIAGYDHQYRNIFAENRLVRADTFPLGIDYEKFQYAARNESISTVKSDILTRFRGCKIIFSVDRLDYTKGVTNRLSGYEQFLKNHPEWHGRVVLILVVVPSREIISKYNERRNLIEEQVGRVNGMWSTLEWQPVMYRYGRLAFDELCALYQAANVALITPLRDGMNLVAKEFVASRVNEDGVLILSELAGAASEMGEAVLVNPLDIDQVATAIQKALMLSQDEQRKSMMLMQQRLQQYTVHHWVKDFIDQLGEIKTLQEQRKLKVIDQHAAEQIVRAFKNAERRHLFLDYDGTLVPFARNPRESKPGAELLQLLKRLTHAKNTEVTIISGRNSDILEEWFAHISVHIVAEHGASMRLTGNRWIHANTSDQGWKSLIRPTFDLFVQRCPGSFVEEKKHTLAWHYRNAEPDLGFARSRELLDNLYHLIRNAQLQVIDGNKVIEVRVAGINKGVAAAEVLKQKPADFILVIGDDKTDEDMFHALSRKAVTVKVGQGVTEAQYILNSQKEVHGFLELLIQ